MQLAAHRCDIRVILRTMGAPGRLSVIADALDAADIAPASGGKPDSRHHWPRCSIQLRRCRWRSCRGSRLDVRHLGFAAKPMGPRRRQLGLCFGSAALRGCAAWPATMKTMHRTSKAGYAIGVFAIAIGASALAALTSTGAGGVYAFAFIGLFAYLFFLMWPDRTRFRGRPTRRSRMVRGPR
jgi:hypothetical protein